VTEVTALKAGQVALEQSKEHLRQLFSLSADGVVVTDHDSGNGPARQRS